MADDVRLLAVAIAIPILLACLLSVTLLLTRVLDTLGNLSSDMALVV